ncbi:Tat pathway signal protein [Poseidonocella sp. HB161398]|uniref:Acg family FMN-binding oxidoreductase n=1 Tax=Poseidonocella sp. HB161398 TaxID=2320855 RepID=UPI001107CEF7|nr:Tat pathway signal protein [Poseidonocella sp. HB161398]
MTQSPPPPSSDLPAPGSGGAARRMQAEAARQRRPVPGAPLLEELVRQAALAANAHNTQPWQFLVAPERIRILPDPARRTPVVDPDDHHLHLSLGCAAENLILAASAEGIAARAAWDGNSVAIALGPAGSCPHPDRLAAAIPLRQTTRGPYDGSRAGAAELLQLEAAGAAQGVALRLCTEATALEALAEIAASAAAAQLADPAFRAELLAWLRFSPARALATGDGLYGPSAGAPALPDWLGRRLFGAALRPQAEGNKLRAEIASSAGVAVFAGAGQDPASRLRTGRSLQRVCLAAARLGLRTAPVNQPVEVPAFRGALADWAGMPGRRPDFVLRFGRAPAMPWSLRRPPAAVIRRDPAS